MIKKKKRRYNTYRYHVVGKYIDTVTKAELKIVYFIGDTGDYKISGMGLPEIVLKGCRLQIKNSEIKRKKKFAKQLQPYIDFSKNWREVEETNKSIKVPLLFGLLKLRKGKQRKFILLQSADIYYKSKVVNLMAVVIDNLLYLDLVNRLKNNH